MKKNIYETIVCLLALASVGFAIADLSGGMTKAMIMIDGLIYVFFLIEYVVRLITSNNKKQFFKNNIFDLIAIIPFSSAFRIFRTFKLARLLKLTKLLKATRFLALFGRMWNKANTFLSTNGFKYMLLLSCAMIGIGGISISFAEGMSIPDGIWWAFVTATTVGYGDISPSTLSGRIIACLLMICGIGLIGSLTSAITSFFMNRSPSEKNDVNNGKIKMTLMLYNELNESEKKLFKNKIE